MSGYRQCGFIGSFDISDTCLNKATHWYIDCSALDRVASRCDEHQISSIHLRLKEITWDEVSVYEVMWL